jgi:hypothetical protein
LRAPVINLFSICYVGCHTGANLDYTGAGPFIRLDGLLTISWFLFAIAGAGKLSLDYLLFGRRSLNDRRTFSSPAANNSPPE